MIQEFVFEKHGNHKFRMFKWCKTTVISVSTFGWTSKHSEQVKDKRTTSLVGT